MCATCRGEGKRKVERYGCIAPLHSKAFTDIDLPVLVRCKCIAPSARGKQKGDAFAPPFCCPKWCTQTFVWPTSSKRSVRDNQTSGDAKDLVAFANADCFFCCITAMAIRQIKTPAMQRADQVTAINLTKHTEVCIAVRATSLHDVVTNLNI